MIGGGNSALQEALLLSEVCNKVTVVQNLGDFTGEKKLAQALMEKQNVEVFFNTVVTGYQTKDGGLSGLELKNDLTGATSAIAVDGAFLAVGLLPENEAFAGFAPLNPWGYFDSAEDCLTPTEGLFVAGDCRSKRIRQVVTAASDGAIAATAACMYLDRQ
jgi:thioredoxin reductase (NADPH)